jgi:hypothetical protein
MLATIAGFATTFAGPHGTSTPGGVTVEAWQVINLIGAPLLAIMFAQPVVDDVKAWITSLREEQAPRRRP